MSDNGDSRVVMMSKLILRKDLSTIKVLNNSPVNAELIKKLKTFSRPLYKEDLLYQSINGDFLKLEPNIRLTLVNRLNLITKSSHTVARYEQDGRVVEKTSENITNLIGKENYDLVFSTLCSVISQEFKIRGILALLTAPKKTDTSQIETFKTPSGTGHKVLIDSSNQTDESSFDIMMKTKPRRRVKRQHPTPYVVTDRPEVKRILIDPSDFTRFSTLKKDTSTVEISSEIVKFPAEEKCKSELSSASTIVESDSLPVLQIDDDNSRESIGGYSQISDSRVPSEILHAPMSILNNIDRVTSKPEQTTHPDMKQITIDWKNGSTIPLLDGTVLRVPVKIEDEFHVASPEVMKYVPRESWRKVLLYQLYMDWKLCLRRDEDNLLAIHSAVLDDDVDLVRRQCLVLKSKEQSVDVPTGDNASALQLSLLGGTPRCTSTLLQHGADPLIADYEYRNCYHLAAEADDAGHLRALLAHSRQHPLKILEESEELWKPELELKPKEYQASFLLKEICSMADNQGYTPLMLAAKLGRAENVKALIEAAPDSINKGMSTSGNTALHLAVESACHEATNRGNKSKIADHFRETITILVENGADPSTTNDSGVDINALLTDFNSGDLTMLIANRLTYVNTKDASVRASEPMMIIKSEDGTLNTVNVRENRKNKEKINKKTDKDKDKPKSIGVVKKTTRDDNETAIGNNDTDLIPVNGMNTVIKTIKTEPIILNFEIKKETSEANSPKKNDGRKFVILENKIISPVKPNVQYINTYKDFVENFDAKKEHAKSQVVKKAKTVKRKLSDEDTTEMTPVSVKISHPRVKTLRRRLMKELNIPKTEESKLAEAKPIKSNVEGIAGDSTSQHIQISHTVVQMDTNVLRKKTYINVKNIQDIINSETEDNMAAPLILYSPSTSNSLSEIKNTPSCRVITSKNVAKIDGKMTEPKSALYSRIYGDDGDGNM